ETKPRHMAVRVLNPELVAPRKILGGHEDACPSSLVLLVEAARVLDTHPEPGSRLTLVGLAKVDRGLVPADASEGRAPPIGILESQDLGVELQAGGQVSNA